MQAKAVAVMVLVAATALFTGAQERSARPVTNPYQEGLPYTIGSDLVVDVDVDGVWWTLVRAAPQDGAEVRAGKDTPVVADLRFDNHSDRSVRLTVVLMLEDEDERPLERLQFPKVKLPANRVKDFQYRFSVPGDDLMATRRVYLFCQVE